MIKKPMLQKWNIAKKPMLYNIRKKANIMNYYKKATFWYKTKKPTLYNITKKSQHRPFGYISKCLFFLS